MDRLKVVHTGGWGLVWFAGWLFTLGYLKLTFWAGALAVLIWPYNLGAALAALHH